MDIFYKEAGELSKMLANKEISAVELAKAFIERTKQVEPKINAFLSYDEADTLKMAEASDARRAKGETLGELDGIPISLKDIVAVENKPLTCASKMLENYVSPYTATSVKNLQSAGAVLWGRLNMDEFAMGSSCENSAFKKTSNPWDISRVPGGSSGGSAAAVAAGECAIALGSDTGGSIRQPASFCGVVGVKPTYGLISRYGLAAFASSLDQIGSFSRSVRDSALFLKAAASYDRLDSTSVKIDIPNYAQNLSADALKGKKIGIPKEYFVDGMDSEVKSAIENAVLKCKELGAEIVEISLPHTELAIPVYYIIATAEASSNLARYDGIRYTYRSKNASDVVDLYYKSRAEAFGEEVKRRIILGSYVLSSGYYDAYYLRAQKVRTLIRNDFLEAFKKVDIIAAPTAPTCAFKIGEKTDDPLAMYLNDIFTINVNLAGLPGMSLPCAFNSQGLPIGLQFIANAFEEQKMLSCAYAFEQASGLFGKHPNL